MDNDNLLRANLDPVVLATLAQAKQSRAIKSISGAKNKQAAKREYQRQAARNKVLLDIQPEIAKLLGNIASDYGVSLSGLVGLSILVLAQQIIDGLDISDSFIPSSGPKFRHKIEPDKILDQEKIINYFIG
jgi:hypothetical protein